MFRFRALAVGVLVTALVVAACSSSDSDSDSSSSSSEAAADPNGVIKIPATLATIGPIGDPVTAGSAAWYDTGRLIYDSLLRKSPDGLQPGLAAEAEQVDASTIDVTLHEGLRFSDGTPLDAAAVKASFERNIASKNGRAFRQELFLIKAIDVGSPTELTLHFAQPVAGGFYPRLANIEGVVVPVAAAASLGDHPVGAGPYRLERLSPNQEVVLGRNPTYFQADQVRAAGVTITNIDSPTSLTNALLTDAVDTGRPVFAQLATLEAAPDVDVDVRPDGNALMSVQFCKSKPPFNDPRVRQALYFATDKEALNQRLYEGNGEAATGLFPSDNPLHDDRFDDQYPYDVDRARQLLQAAGAAPLTFAITVTPGEVTSVAEVLQDQWRRAGIEVSLVTTQNIVTDFLQTAKTPAGIVPTTGTNGMPRKYLPGQISNVCSYDDPALQQLLLATSGVDASDEAAVKAAWSAVQEPWLDDALEVITVFTPTLTATSTRLGGVSIIGDALDRPTVDLLQLYVKA